LKYLISFALRHIPRKYLQLISHWGLQIVGLFYLGNNVECPITGQKYRKFLPYGRIPRENALCPGSLSLERHRLMWLYLKDKTNFFTAHLKVLHIAPEYCFIDKFTQMKNLDYITADLESPLAKVKMDIHQMPFGDSEFDVVFCNHVMEHVDDDIQSMKEIVRVLKPGGWAIIQSPLEDRDTTFEDKSLKTPKERERVFGQDDHVRAYGRDYGKRLESAGFKVKADHYNQELPEAVKKRYALPEYEDIYVCYK
jgi:SAM-dependent methyltransferase